MQLIRKHLKNNNQVQIMQYSETDRNMKTVFLTGLFFIFTLSLQAHTWADSLYRKVNLNEVTISVNRDQIKKINSPQQVFIFPQNLIRQSNAQNMCDLLMERGTLSVQKSQQGGGSPGIRGFEASRVLLVIDNVRMNNLIYRAGHLQNSITVDQSMLDDIEILYGSSSLNYGSDALGGTIHFHTRQPELKSSGSQKLFKGNMYARYGSSNNEGTGHIDFNIGGEKFASLTSVTYSHFGDLRAGRNSNPFLPDTDSYIHLTKYVKRIDGKDVVVDNDKKHLQIGSGYNQYDILQKLLFKPTSDISHLLNLQFSNTTNVGRYDRLTEMKKKLPKYSEWYYGPQFRFMGAYEFKTYHKMGADKTNLSVAYQKIKESRHNRKYNDDIRANRMEEVDVITLTSDWIKYLGKNTFHTGIDGTLSYVSSTANRENIITGEKQQLDTRYPDGGSHMHTVEGYFTHIWQITPRLSLNDGMRVGYSNVYSSFNNKQYFQFLNGTVNQKNFTYSLAVGLNYLPADTWKLALSISTGYRVPNVDDLSKVFDSQAGMVVVPNPGIKPEQTITADINITKHIGDKFIWENVFYGTYYFDAIGLAPATFNGQDSIMYDGELSKVYASKNNRRAYLWGYSTTLRAKISKCFMTDIAFNYTYGKITSTPQSPLDHIPPIFGRLGVSYQDEKDKCLIEFYSLFNSRKKKSMYNLDGEDNIKYATLSGIDGEGIPAWFTLNLKANYKIQKGLMLQAGVENILDTEYRLFASGINAPGRNIYAAIRASF